MAMIHIYVVTLTSHPDSHGKTHWNRYLKILDACFPPNILIQFNLMLQSSVKTLAQVFYIDTFVDLVPLSSKINRSIT